MTNIHPEPSIEPAARSRFESADPRRSSFDGWLQERMQINIDKRLMQLDLDMILEPFVNRPGKQWWAGEHAGKFLHAATCAWQYTGRDDLRERIDHAARTLMSTQQSNGYLGTYVGEDQLGEGDGLGWDGPVWDVWTHKYTLIGLLTYHQATGEAQSLEASRRAADLLYEHFAVQKRPMRLASAHVGMAATSVLEPIAMLYRLTGEQRYLGFCHYIVNSWDDPDNPYTWKYEDGCRLLASLLEHGNVHKTANRKAYEMLSNLVGLLELYRVDPDERYLTACKNAWQDIVANRLYVTGTTSYFEQFTPDHRLPPGHAVGEGCVTVTWLQLSLHLLELTGEVQYADELERTIYNALPGAQSPHTGEVSYFTPLVGHKAYNDHDKGEPPISCCSSSIPRGMAMIPACASGTLNGRPALLQYISGKHALRDGVTLQVRGDYPGSGELEIEVDVEQAAEFTLVLRVPAWAEEYEASIDNEAYRSAGDRLLEISRRWSSGDTVRVRIPLGFRVVTDGDKTTESVALARGPQILATDTHINQAGGLPTEGWWGDTIHSCRLEQHGEVKELQLVSFADAGQTKEAYVALHEGIQLVTEPTNE